MLLGHSVIRCYGQYVEAMADASASPEPTLADVLSAIAALGADVAKAKTDIAVIKAGQIESRIAEMQSTADFTVLRDSYSKMHGAVSSGFDSVRRDIERLRTDEAAHSEQIRADVAGVKADTAFVEGYVNDMHEAVRRHIIDPSAHRNAA